MNTIGLLGSTVGPSIIGALRDLTGSFAAGLSFVVVSVSVGRAVHSLGGDTHEAQRAGRSRGGRRPLEEERNE